MAMHTASAESQAETIFEYDFEEGWGDWYTDNGVWEIGSATAGPGASHGGDQCAGTVLSGDYPEYTDSRLISPSITLSSVSGDEELSIRFWHWFSYATYGYGYTQISTYESTSGTCGTGFLMLLTVTGILRYPLMRAHQVHGQHGKRLGMLFRVVLAPGHIIRWTLQVMQEIR